MPSASRAGAEQVALATIRTKHLEGEKGVSRQEEALDRLLVDQDLVQGPLKRDKSRLRGTAPCEERPGTLASKEPPGRPGEGSGREARPRGPHVSLQHRAVENREESDGQHSHLLEREDARVQVYPAPDSAPAGF